MEIFWRQALSVSKPKKSIDPPEEDAVVNTAFGIGTKLSVLVGDEIALFLYSLKNE